jgi:transposase
VPETIVGRILRLPGYGVFQSEFDEQTSTTVLRVRQVAAHALYTCGGCGIDVADVHDVRERRVRDLPWGAWKVYLLLEVHRVRCRRCAG